MYPILDPTSLASGQQGHLMEKKTLWILLNSTWQSKDTHFGSEKELTYYSGNHSIRTSLEQSR